MLDRRYDKLLIPYLEGSLDPNRRAQLEEAIANDPVLAEEVEQMRRLKYQLQRSAANFSSATSSNSAWPGVQARIQASRPPIFRTSSFWGLGLTMGTAAALAVAFGTPYISLLSRQPAMSASGLNKSHAPSVGVRHDGAVVASNENSVFSAISGALAPLSFPVANAVKQPAPTSTAFISVPNILPVGSHQTSVGDQAQLADADIPHDGLIHGAVVSMATYSMPFVQPTNPTVPELQPAPRYAVADQATKAVVASNVTGMLQNGGRVVNNAAQVYSLGAFGGGAATAQAPASVGASAVAPSVHLATMSTPTSTADSLSTDSPLIKQLRTVDDQAAADAASGAQSRALARWQSVLQATSSSAVFGDDSSQLLSMQSLEAIQAAGLLSAMRQELEQWQEQDPSNIGVRRMLASLYSVQGETSLALDQRRKAAALPTAIGEDWFQLGWSEEQAGNVNSANVDYNKALQCGDLSNTMHINYVRQRQPQSES